MMEFPKSNLQTEHTPSDTAHFFSVDTKLGVIGKVTEGPCARMSHKFIQRSVFFKNKVICIPWQHKRGYQGKGEDGSGGARTEPSIYGDAIMTSITLYANLKKT